MNYFTQYMVSVKCITFNHARFIKDAMDGFTIQKTDFPFVCVIIDDASTDGEPEIIRKYLSDNFDLEGSEFARKDETDNYYLIFARHKTNLNCYFAILFLKENHYRKKSKDTYIKEWVENSKYIALCEGDDYWTDPLKLQKQVDFLESHPDYSMCCTNVEYLHRDGSVTRPLYRCHFTLDSKDLYIEDIIMEGGAYICTPSILIRTNIVKELNYKNREKSLHVGDYPLQIYAAYKGKVRMLKDISAIYRYLSVGSWNERNLCKKDDIFRQSIILLGTMNEFTENKYNKLFKKKNILLNYNYYINKSPIREWIYLLSSPRIIFSNFNIKMIVYSLLPNLIKSMLLKFKVKV